MNQDIFFPFCIWHLELLRSASRSFLKTVVAKSLRLRMGASQKVFTVLVFFLLSFSTFKFFSDVFFNYVTSYRNMEASRNFFLSFSVIFFQFRFWYDSSSPDAISLNEINWISFHQRERVFWTELYAETSNKTNCLNRVRTGSEIASSQAGILYMCWVSRRNLTFWLVPNNFGVF